MASNTPSVAVPAPMIESLRLLLSERETAKALGLCTRTLFTLRQRGEIPYLKIGGRILYSPSVLEEWIRAKQEGGAR